MKVQFKYSRSIDGHLYAPGIHELPEASGDHWFFKCLLDVKDIQILEQIEKPESPDFNSEIKEEKELKSGLKSKGKRSKG